MRRRLRSGKAPRSLLLPSCTVVPGPSVSPQVYDGVSLGPGFGVGVWKHQEREEVTGEQPEEEPRRQEEKPKETFHVPSSPVSRTETRNSWYTPPSPSGVHRKSRPDHTLQEPG